MSSALPAEGLRVAVFAKAPVPGTVKTRLAVALGPQGAADLHAELAEHALATAASAAIGFVELWCAPDTSHDFFRRCAERYGARLRAQRGEDLGSRMAFAFETAFSEGCVGLVLIGSDCPALAPKDVRAAACALREHDAAFIPAEDGGYVLVALGRALPAVFEGVDWGTSTVMEQTRARLAAAGATWKELPARWDVDRPEDVDRLRRERLLGQAAE